MWIDNGYYKIEETFIHPTCHHVRSDYVCIIATLPKINANFDEESKHKVSPLKITRLI